MAFVHVGIGDERLTAYRSVADPDLANRLGLFVAEGRFVVERLIALRRHRIHSVLVSERARIALAGVLDQLDDVVPVFVAGARDLESITGFHLHRGCVALAHRPAAHPAADWLERARTVVVLDGLSDPDNVGSIFRSASALGGDAVLLSPATCDPLYRKAIRTSMAASLVVPWARATAWPDDVARLRDAGFLLVAVVPRGAVDTLEALVGAMSPDQRVALLVGNGSPTRHASGCGIARATRVCSRPSGR